MADILNEITTRLPPDAEIVTSAFEGANIILYTKNKDFFLENRGEIRKLVSEFRKRIELRPDPSLTLDQEKAEVVIKELLPKEASVDNMIFDAQRSIVIIETDKPSVIIGKTGELLRTIKEKTLWVPLIRRTPPLRSKITENIRGVLYENNDYRRKFLHGVGKRIYNGWIRGRKNEWVRVTVLGAGRQVGRSCFLLQTPESRVMLDCGINPGATEEDAYPFFDAPEFKINELDAVIISHAHLDHCLPPHTPVLLKGGEIKPIDTVEKGDELVSIDFKTGKQTIGKCTGKIRTKAHNEVYYIRMPYFSIEASPNHRFFVVENLEVKEVTASALHEGSIIPGMLTFPTRTKRIELQPVAYNERVPLPRKATRELRRLRALKRLTQLQVSKQMRRGINFVSDVENKYHNITTHHLRNILRMYETDRKQFFNQFGIQETTFPKIVTPELAQVMGYLTGDGHLASEYSIRATDKSVECLQEYATLVKEVFNHESRVRRHSDQTKNANIIEINNVGIRRFLKENFRNSFLPSNNKAVPEKIILSSEAVIRKFVRGLADAEGSVNSNVAIASSSRDLLHTVQFMLSSLGIPASINKKGNVLSIASHFGIRKYAELIGFSHPKKRTALDNLLQSMAQTDERLREVIPISSSDLDSILDGARIKGRAEGRKYLTELPLGITDWRRRKDGFAERKTVQKLVHILEKRIGKMKATTGKNLRQKRIVLSLSLSQVSQRTGLTVMQIQYRERERLRDNIYERLNRELERLLSSAIQETEKNARKIKNILTLPVLWQQVTTITKKKNPYPYLVDIEVEPTKNFVANGVVVHNSAMVPLLLKYGYKGPIYCTEPTRDIMSLLALDFISIGFKDGRKPPFEINDVKEMVKQTICLGFEEVTDITPDIRLTFYNAGHILGSAMAHLNIGNGVHNLLYTGDMLFDNSNLLSRANTRFPRLETVMIESTYGSRDDVLPPRQESEDLFMDIVKKTIARGGKLLLPVLGVGRSQEVMVMIERAIREGTIPRIPVYVQGLVWDVTAIHTAYPEFFNSAMRKLLFYDNQNPFLSDIFTRVASQKEMQQVVDSGDPCLILATSGMMTGGASVEYFKGLAENPKHSMILTCYQAEGTLGRRLQNGEKEIGFPAGDGKSIVIPVRCEVYMIKGFSGHSSRPQLLAFIRYLDPRPKRVIMQHGEVTKCLDLASTVHKVMHIETSVPRNLETVRLV